MISAVAALALIFIASAEEYNPCSEFKPIENFDFDAFSGQWYELARFPTHLEDHFDCVVVRYYRDGKLLKFSVNDVSDNTHKEIPYFGTIERVDKSGRLDFFSPVYQNWTQHDKVRSTAVVANYEHFCIFYQCDYDADKKTVDDDIWILSRSKTLEPEAKKSMEEFFKANKYLNVNKLIWNHFSDDACKSKT